MPWYFFSWESQSASFSGNQCLWFSDEFDLEAAHEFILKAHKQIGIIKFYSVVSSKNVDGFHRFIGKASRLSDPRRGLKVVK
jgi:hypothetical protein